MSYYPNLEVPEDVVDLRWGLLPEDVSRTVRDRYNHRGLSTRNRPSPISIAWFTLCAIGEVWKNERSQSFHKETKQSSNIAVESLLGALTIASIKNTGFEYLDSALLLVEERQYGDFEGYDHVQKRIDENAQNIIAGFGAHYFTRTETDSIGFFERRQQRYAAMANIRETHDPAFVGVVSENMKNNSFILPTNNL